MEPLSPGTEALSILLEQKYIYPSSVFTDDDLKDEVKIEAVRTLFRDRLFSLSDKQILAAVNQAIDTVRAHNERAWRLLTRDLEERGK